ncbi:hypothetical protein [Falsiroseomonas stagni]|uniref:Uncharacterized protein n=1 Tax=Falsiroseomonas stagni DSM 19981 TaxID=1123062 RepID=A0A1I4D5J9_9PROT|nr:hypothetical protein [Falsiroseomonas stagni]SFK87426.1 hypothetical protein SAMN02745775_10985 [Falsiroseomonas stagni DSM 19981]
MGWWEKKSSRWQSCVVAQAGGAAVLGGGVFFIQFRSPDVSVKPCFVAIAGGAGMGGSIGSAVSIPYSDIVRQLINPNFRPPTDDYGWGAMSGNFSCEDIQREQFDIAQIGASAVVIGAQLAAFTIREVAIFGEGDVITATRFNIPRNLPSFGRAVLDLPQVQGAIGVGGFAFRGVVAYIGAG